MQDIDVDIGTLTPLTPQIISRQATINIGTIGHVAHGKSTLVRAISGVNVRNRFLSYLTRLCVITRKDSEISPLSSVMPTPSCTSALLASPPSATNLLVLRKKIALSARAQVATRPSY